MTPTRIAFAGAAFLPPLGPRLRRSPPLLLLLPALLVVAALFLAALLFSPLAAMVPSYATAPALLFVAGLMLRELVEVKWDDLTESVPAALCALAMPFTYSIANGLAFGFITYAAVKLFTGRVREVHPMVWIIAGVFLFKFFYIGGH